MALVPAVAEAGKKPLHAQLIGAPQVKGKNFKAPVLLNQRTANKLKLRSPLATLIAPARRNLQAPNPFGAGKIKVEGSSLRAGDVLRGKAKLKGKRNALMPKVKGKKLKVRSRESAFSVDELTVAIFALSGQLTALTLRVDELEKSMLSELASLRAELEALAAKFPDLQAQIDNILAQIDVLESGLADLQSQLGSLSGTVTGLEGDMAAVQTTVAGLQSDLAALQSDLTTLEGTVGTLSTNLDAVEADLAALDGRVTSLEGTVALLCGASLGVC